MKFNKLLAAALVAASSASSMAAIITPGTGNGELTLVLWDSVDKVSYVKDLGVTLDAFDPLAALSFSLSDTSFASFLTAANATAGGVSFAVIGGDSIAAGGRRTFTTIDNVVTPLSGSLVVNANAYINAFQSANNLLGDHSTNTNGSSFALPSDGQAYALFGTGSNVGVPGLLNAATGWTTGNAIGVDAAFRGFNAASTTGTQAVQTTFAGLWSVTNAGGAFTANYTVAAVPEADGIAMALAGLGALGFVALRRRQN